MTRRLLSALSAVTLFGVGFLVSVNTTDAGAAEIADDLYVDESFQGDTVPNDWLAIGRTPATTPAIIKPEAGHNPGQSRWLQLTSDQTHNGDGESGFVLNNNAFSSSKGVVIEYDQRIYRTNNGRDGAGAGDGLSVFLVDGDIAGSTTEPKGSGFGTNIDTTTDEAGGFGGGLGYSSIAGQNETWCGPSQQQGVAGGWFGLGFDVYGNFANSDWDERGGYVGGRTRPHKVSGGLELDNTEDGLVPPKPSTRQMVGLRGSGVRHTPDGRCTEFGNNTDLNYWYGMNRSGFGTDMITHGGYQWLGGSKAAGALDNDYGDASRYRKVRILLTPSATSQSVTLEVQMTGKISVTDDELADSGLWGTRPLLQPEYTTYLTTDIGAAQFQADMPDTFKVGFAASTGWAVNHHQIRNLKVFAPADLALQKSVSDATAYVGDRISYTLDVTNNGPTELNPAFPATITDDLKMAVGGDIVDLPLTDVEWTAAGTGGAQVRQGGSTIWAASATGQGPIAPGDLEWHGPEGSAVQVVVSATVTAPVAPLTWNSDLINTAVVATSTVGGPQDSNPDNNRDTAVFQIPPLPALDITKDDGVTEVSIGQETTYELAVQNTGPAAAVDAVVTDTLPVGLEYVSSTPAGASATVQGDGTTTVTFPVVNIPAGGSLAGYSVTAKVVQGAPESIRNTVQIQATNDCQDLPIAERCVDEDVNILQSPDWTILKINDAADEVSVGDTISYTVTATNDGPGTVFGAVLTDNLSDVLTYGTFVPDSATVDVAGTITSVANPSGAQLVTPPVTIPPAGTAVLTYRVTVNSDAHGQTLRNVVTGTAVTTPPSTCADPATAGEQEDCWTQTLVTGQYLLTKVDSAGNALDGATFRILADDDGEPGEVVLDALTAGSAVLTGLETGTYFLEEIAAPAGHQLLAAQVRFTVTTGGTPALVVVDADGAPVTDGLVTVLDDGLTLEVQDVPGLVLPEAGGPGISAHLLLGGGLLLAALLTFIQRSRRLRPRADLIGGGALSN